MKINTIKTTTYPLGCLNLKRPSVGKDVEELELSYTAGGNSKWYNHFVKQFGSLF